MTTETKERISELYEELKGTRTVNGELRIAGFGSEEYEILYETIIHELHPFFEENFWSWYGRVVVSYIRFRRANSHSYDFYCPQQRPLDEHTLREQLAVFKYFIYRRATGKYTK